MTALYFSIAVLGIATTLAIAAFVLGAKIIFPAIVQWRYKLELSGDKFTRAEGGTGAGSADLVYFSAYFDAHEHDQVISGPAPNAPYWQIGIFDAEFRQLDRGHLSNRTVHLDERGNFRVLITRATAAGSNSLCCDTCARGIVIYRVLLPREPVVAPSITSI